MKWIDASKKSPKNGQLVFADIRFGKRGRQIVVALYDGIYSLIREQYKMDDPQNPLRIILPNMPRVERWMAVKFPKLTEDK